MPEILQNTRDYLQQVKDIGDEDLDIPSSLMSSVERAAEAAEAECSGEFANVIDPFPF